jgi:hypothetical protein
MVRTLWSDISPGARERHHLCRSDQLTLFWPFGLCPTWTRNAAGSSIQISTRNARRVLSGGERWRGAHHRDASTSGLTILDAGFHPRQRFGVWFRCPSAGTAFDGIEIPLTADSAGVKAQFRFLLKLLNLLRAQTTSALLWFHVQPRNECRPLVGCGSGN